MAEVRIIFPDRPLGVNIALTTVAALRAVDSTDATESTVVAVENVGMFFWEPTSTAGDDGTTIIKPDDKTSLQAGRWIKLPGGMANLSDFGIAGRGNATEDTATFTAAVQAMTGPGWTPVPLPDSYFGGQYFTGPAVFVPPGHYKVNGGISVNGVLNLWCIPGTVTITNQTDTYLFTCSISFYLLNLRGFTIIDGKGALRHSYTGENVTNDHYVVENNFLGYTEAAVASDANNFPYLNVRNNRFACDRNAVGVTKGLVLGGLLDNGDISGNKFQCNRIHMQIGPTKSGSLVIRNNELLSFVADYTDVDIWFIPDNTVGEAGFGTNSAPGLCMLENKFGNELLGDAEPDKRAPRVMIAAASGGTNRALFTMDLTWKNGDDGANWFRGSIWKNNRISTSNVTGEIEGAGNSFIVSYIERITEMVFRDNPIDGGRFKYLIEFMDGGTYRPGKDNYSNIIELIPQRDRASAVLLGVSNRIIGPYDSAAGALGGPFANMPLGLADPDATSLALVDDYSDWSREAGVSPLTGTTDRAGGNTAALVVFPNENAGIYMSATPTTAQKGQRGWFSLDLGTAASEQIGAIKLLVTTTYTGGGSNIRVLLDETITVNSAGFDRRYADFPIPSDSVALTFYVRPGKAKTANTYWSASTDQAVLGNARWSVGRTPLAIP